MTATTYATVFRLRGKVLKAMFGRLRAPHWSALAHFDTTTGGRRPVVTPCGQCRSGPRLFPASRWPRGVGAELA